MMMIMLIVYPILCREIIECKKESEKSLVEMQAAIMMLPCLLAEDPNFLFVLAKVSEIYSSLSAF